MPKASESFVPLLIVLTFANVLNFADRSLIFVLGEPIKREIGLSDTQLGLLQGAAFALIYASLALPLSRVADRGFGKRIMLISITCWSLLTTIGGFAQNFFHLAAMRVGVAAGEAGLQPSAHALISRQFPPERRGLVLAIFTLGLPVGMALGSFLGGWLANSFSWRAAFFVLGPVGLLLLPFILWLVPADDRSENRRTVSVLAAAKHMFHISAFCYMWMGMAFATIFGYGTGAFLVSFYMREHGLDALEAGVLYGSINGGMGLIAILASGFLHDRLSRLGLRNALIPVIGALILSALIAPIGWLTPSLLLSIGCITVALLLYLLINVPTIAITQTICPPGMRASTSALIGLANGLAGSVCGPLIAGVISDFMTHQGGHNPLGRALSVIALLQFLAAGFYYLAYRSWISEAQAVS